MLLKKHKIYIHRCRARSLNILEPVLARFGYSYSAFHVDIRAKRLTNPIVFQLGVKIA
jgi:hypothetical protein